MNNDDIQWMRAAIAESLRGMRSGLGGPFGTVIVRNGALLSVGSNEVLATNDPTAHGEIVAIRRACQQLGTFQLGGCTLYTSCEPCPMCLGAIYWSRPDRVFYAGSKIDAARAGFDDQLIYDELDVMHAQRRIPMIQILRDEAMAGFDEWRSKTDKIAY